MGLPEAHSRRLQQGLSRDPITSPLRAQFVPRDLLLVARHARRIHKASPNISSKSVDWLWREALTVGYKRSYEGFFLPNNKGLHMTDCTTEPLLFSSLPRQRVVADFAGGTLTSDSGLLLLREVNRAHPAHRGHYRSPGGSARPSPDHPPDADAADPADLRPGWRLRGSQRSTDPAARPAAGGAG